MSNRYGPNNRHTPKPSAMPVPEVQEEMPVPEVQEEMSEMKPTPVVKKAIEVVALRPGFFQNVRRAEGDVFTIPNFGVSGEWMRCTDPKMEMEHQAFISERRRDIKEKYGKDVLAGE